MKNIFDREHLQRSFHLDKVSIYGDTVRLDRTVYLARFLSKKESPCSVEIFLSKTHQLNNVNSTILTHQKLNYCMLTGEIQ